MLGRFTFVVAVALIIGTLWQTFEAGRAHERAIHEAEATAIARQVEEATQRAAERLRYASQSVKEADARLAIIESEIFHETAAPDLCAVDPGRVLRLDRIR